MKIDFRYLFLQKKAPSIEEIETFLEDKATKRIHFATTHSNALKPPKDTYHGTIQIPFTQTIEQIIVHKIGDEVNKYFFDSQKGGYWRGFKSKNEYEKCESFIKEYNHIVFLRDTLDLSLALSMNMLDDDSRTEIGELEYQAKYKNNEASEREIVDLVKDWLNKLPYYDVADTICAMPCTNPTNPGLPRRIVDKIEKYENISAAIQWNNKNKSLKELGSIEEKLTALKEFELTITSDLKGKNVILLDDLYMSGISMQFVALKLKEAGADRVFGISIVKSRNNTAL
ncbi:hypothetical protein ORI89_05450 [Sphingobacterium sp. UT-1RO-CII-1]|uniref:phosphoribosyltransferase n=1 Tax=Sphingobacterium sp. UT-1RO-CII-1 TaxID=2995225 RepID=UPI00227C3A6C|nr:hypothetical protein [Sphingobacterium sp. UT-1RO-CII-1]MCY4779085.1 hypothetical protein [Sphingobacterium sp. UT-1RO-CII-1]